MTDIYIGVRANASEASKVLGTDFRYLRERHSKLLRRAGRALGIKGQEKGKRLNYYVVDESQYLLYTEYGMADFIKLRDEVNWQPLVSIEVDKLTELYEEINQRYPHRLTEDLYKKYESEVVQGLAQRLKVIP